MYCTLMAPPSSCYNSACASLAASAFVSSGPGIHRFYKKDAMANTMNKSLPKGSFLDLMGKVQGKCIPRFGSNGISIRCAGASSGEPKSEGFSLRKCALCLAVAASIVTMQLPVSPVYAFQAGPALPDLSVLISGPPIKDPKALLRYALPIDNKPIREVQKSLEDITENLKVPGLRALDSVERNIRYAARVLKQNKPAILAGVAESKKEHGQELLDKLTIGLQEFEKIVEEKDRDAVAPKQQELLEFVGGHDSSISSGRDLISERGSNRYEEWRTDLFGCCMEPSLCMKTCIYPCGTFSNIAVVASNGKISPERACNDLMTYSLVFGCCCYTCCMRRKLRKLLNIAGGLCDDFLTHVMCCCCALVQEWREIENRGLDGLQMRKMSPPPSQQMEY